MKINLVLDNQLLCEGVRYYHSINFEKTPHIMTIGATGSGKTYLNKLIIGKISLSLPQSKTMVLDFKGTDYKLFDSEKVFKYETCIDGLEQFYEVLKNRQNGDDKKRTFRLLAIEELNSMIAFYDTKNVKRIKSIISNIILMGRSFNIHCLISAQRPDSKLFSSGVRDSIGAIIALGNLSKEGKSMLFKDFSDEMTPIANQGVGYLLINGSNFSQIRVPRVRNHGKLCQYLAKTLSW